MSKSKKPDKKTRDLAILICAIAASNPTPCGAYAYMTIQDDLDASLEAFDLAHDAWNYCWHTLYKNSGVIVGDTVLGYELEAETECLLRDGWSPS